jgi:hypothetical protein
MVVFRLSAISLGVSFLPQEEDKNPRKNAADKKITILVMIAK